MGSSQDLTAAFALSKHVVTQETDPRVNSNYDKMIYVEFLEFLVRVAIIMVKKDNDFIDVVDPKALGKKLRHVVDKVLGLVEIERLEQDVQIESDSESDMDY